MPVEKARLGDKPSTVPAEDAVTGVAPVEKVVERGSEDTRTDGQIIHEDGGREKAAKAAEDTTPPAPRPSVGTVLLETPGGYQVVPEGVAPEQVGQNAVNVNR